jgi:hypothetical protein
MPETEADLLELMRADRLVLNKSQAKQGVVDREAPGEVVPAVRIERVSRRGPAAYKGCWRGGLGSRSFDLRAASARLYAVSSGEMHM